MVEQVLESSPPGVAVDAAAGPPPAPDDTPSIWSRPSTWAILLGCAVTLAALYFLFAGSSVAASGGCGGG